MLSAPVTINGRMACYDQQLLQPVCAADVRTWLLHGYLAMVVEMMY
jgi:hypothetical protein